MKISYNWLNTLLHSERDPAEIAELLTAAGLEVESSGRFDSVKGGLAGLVVGEVIECAKHPDADRLSLTKVNVGAGAPLSIVCGAPNVAKGQKVPVATVGATLYPATGEPFTIKKSKIRGAASEGMICAEDEIGLGESHAGIMVLDENAVPGTPLAEYFKLESDTVFEIGLTPNRGDAASHLGVARDLAAALNTHDLQKKYTIEFPPLASLETQQGGPVKIKIASPDACPRYSWMIVKGVRVQESPSWIKNRLNAAGLRPLNNIVDITNFVMLELGQPLHAFDLDKIRDQKITVRMAAAGETLTTLDGIERKLSDSDLVIADGKGAMCLAGVLGGAQSGVTEGTTNILVESAYFNPSAVRRTARRHGIHTDAAFRFERGTDPGMTETALRRAAWLLEQTGVSSEEPALFDETPVKLEPFKVAFSYTNCIDLIGKDIDRHLIKNIILNLGIQIDSEGTDGLLLYVPRFRGDVTREVDVIEEVLRIYGHNHVEPSRHVHYAVSSLPAEPLPSLEEKVGTLLSHTGFNEIMGLSLTSEKFAGDSAVVKLKNPLSSDLAVLRTSLLYSGLETITYNVNRRNTDLRLFEFGTVYRHAPEGYTERRMLSLFVTGSLYKMNHYALKRDGDGFYLKSVIDQLLTHCGIKSVKTAATELKWLSSGTTMSARSQRLVTYGAVSADMLKLTGTTQPVWYAEIDLENLLNASASGELTYAEVPKFPAVRRDLALLLEKNVSYEQVESLAFETEKKLLRDVALFDIYEDARLGNKRSLAVSFTLLDEEKTLTDKQIDGVMQRLIEAYRKRLGAELRQ